MLKTMRVINSAPCRYVLGVARTLLQTGPTKDDGCMAWASQYDPVSLPNCWKKTSAATAGFACPTEEDDRFAGRAVALPPEGAWGGDGGGAAECAGCGPIMSNSVLSTAVAPTGRAVAKMNATPLAAAMVGEMAAFTPAVWTAVDCRTAVCAGEAATGDAVVGDGAVGDAWAMVGAVINFSAVRKLVALSRAMAMSEPSTKRSRL